MHGCIGTHVVQSLLLCFVTSADAVPTAAVLAGSCLIITIIIIIIANVASAAAGTGLL